MGLLTAGALESFTAMLSRGSTTPRIAYGDGMKPVSSSTWYADHVPIESPAERAPRDVACGGTC